MIDIALAVLLVGSLGVLGLIVWRKLPQIQVVDPSSSREAKSRERKRAILEDRLQRQATERVQSIKKSTVPVFKAVQDGFRRVAGKLTAIERRYVEMQKQGTGKRGDASELRRLIDEAKGFMSAERFDAAEKTLIELLSLDPKNAQAYEMLGRLYIQTKDYGNAKEALEYLLKLSPKDASVLAGLGEVAELQGRMDDAYAYYEQAKDLSPNNPKYLDFYISTAIDVGKTHEAMVAIDHLREVNPDNKKIAEFDDAISAAVARKKETK